VNEISQERVQRQLGVENSHILLLELVIDSCLQRGEILVELVDGRTVAVTPTVPEFVIFQAAFVP
jgi:hypothetical protein